jgi:hypothetical protein
MSSEDGKGKFVGVAAGDVNGNEVDAAAGVMVEKAVS